MFESPDIKALETEKKELDKYMQEKYDGLVPLRVILVDFALEIKRLRQAIEEIAKPKKGAKNG